MFINKFNKLIRNKWIWGIFAVIVCFLFVASDMFRGDSGSRGGSEFASFEGKPVDYRQYQNALLAVRINDMLANRGVPRIDPDDVPPRAWRFLAAAHTAEKMGLRVSEAELLQHLRALFSDESGNFQPELYARVAMGLQCTEQQFEEADRLQLLVDKVSMAFSLANWASESLAEAQSHGLTDSYTLRTATVSNTFADAEVEIDDEKLQAYYSRNKATYQIPAQVAVRYVAFKVADYVDKVETPDEDDLRYRYDSDPSRYTGEVDGVKTNLTFDAAREQLEAEYKSEKAIDLASDAADDFAGFFFNEARDPEFGAKVTADGFFEATAAAQGLAVATTGLFAAGASVPGIEAAARAAFSTAAFDLEKADTEHLDRSSTYDCYSDPVVGKDYVYVLAYQEKSEAHEPEFDSIREKLVSAVTAEGRDTLFNEKVGKLYENYSAEMDKGRPFEEVAAELGLEVSTNMVMTTLQAQSLPGNPYQWISILPRVGVGESSQFVQYPTGATLIHVLDRQPGDESMRGYYKSSLTEKTRGDFAGNLSENWLEANFKGMEKNIPSEE